METNSNGCFQGEMAPLFHLKMWMSWTDQNLELSLIQNRVSCGFLSIDANYDRYNLLIATEPYWALVTKQDHPHKMTPYAMTMCILYRSYQLGS